MVRPRRTTPRLHIGQKTTATTTADADHAATGLAPRTMHTYAHAHVEGVMRVVVRVSEGAPSFCSRVGLCVGVLHD